MKMRTSVAIASAVVAVPLALGMSAAPASAMPRSCLTMYVAFQQAELESNRANATMTSFQDNVTDYADSDGFYRRTGWYWDFEGQMVEYDLDPPTWTQWDDFNVANAQMYEQLASDAYDSYVSDCAWS